MPPSHPKVQKRRKNQFYFQMGPEPNRIFGVDLTAIPGISALTAHALLAEIGPDLSRFANVAAFASWLALSPANKKSGGKVLSSKSRQTNSRASRALRFAPRRWPASFITCAPPAKHTMRPCSSSKTKNQLNDTRNAYANKPTHSATNSSPSPHEHSVH
jgi:hypothetical protein